MKNIWHLFKKIKSVQISAPIKTVLLFDPLLVPLCKIPKPEKSPIITQICETAKMGNHPDYKK